MEQAARERVCCPGEAAIANLARRASTIVDRAWQDGGGVRRAPIAASPDKEVDLPSRAAGGPQPSDDADRREPPPLGLEEELIVVLRGIGSTMFLTSDRIIVARDGVERRPRSGIQSFPLETIRLVRIERANGSSGRVVVSTMNGQEAVSMFFESRSADRAEELVAKSRLITARRRRGGGTPRPDPSGSDRRPGQRGHRDP